MEFDDVIDDILYEIDSDFLLSEAIRKKAFFIQKPGKEIKFDNSKIRTTLKENIVEVFFKRRVWPVKKATYQRSPYRRMLCTANFDFIKANSNLFQWKTPKSKREPGYYTKRNLAIVWDLIVKAWRIVSLDDYDIINTYPIKSSAEKSEYVKYYNNLLKREGRLKLTSKFNN